MERFRSDSWELCRYRNQITLIRVLSVLGRGRKKDAAWRRQRIVGGGRCERGLRRIPRFSCDREFKSNHPPLLISLYPATWNFVADEESCNERASCIVDRLLIPGKSPA